MLSFLYETSRARARFPKLLPFCFPGASVSVSSPTMMCCVSFAFFCIFKVRDREGGNALCVSKPVGRVAANARREKISKKKKEKKKKKTLEKKNFFWLLDRIT